MEKDKRVSEWVFSRWYFWISFFLMWIITKPKPISVKAELIGSLIGTFIVVGIIFIIIRWIFLRIKNR